MGGAADPDAGVHLVVMVHGYDGGPHDFDNLAATLHGRAALLGLAVETLCPAVGGTHDGVERGAIRVWRAVMRRMRPSPREREQAQPPWRPVSKLSVVGHSLGGLYARFLLRCAWRWRAREHPPLTPRATRSLLADCLVLDEVELGVFATFATPHLGVRRAQVHPIDVAFQRAAWWVNATTVDLFLEDDASRPLLRHMADAEFVDPLRRFARRALYSNVRNDVQIPYWSAALTDCNPYAAHAPSCAVESAAPSIVYPSLTSFSMRTALARPGARHGDALFDHEAEPRRSRLLETLRRLAGDVAWERYDASFATVFAHEQIINKRSAFAGHDVAEHFACVVMFPRSGRSASLSSGGSLGALAEGGAEHRAPAASSLAVS